jgi:ADP-ribose pyrophosphatase YjhB (NUDIX family)
VTAVRETREETGSAARVVGYLGTWIDPYADSGVPTDELVSVQYYAARPLDDSTARPQVGEVTEVAWWPLDDPPPDTAPPGTLIAALGALRAALDGPGLDTLLPDRPAP